tara:strand:+ start:943 stop:1194 length:252 start_codon:yes stop_codon:yes gene_type:complete
MQINISYLNGVDSEAISSTRIISKEPYIASTMETNKMGIKDIILRLEAAIDDKDWDAVKLLLEDLQLDDDDRDFGQLGYDEEY